MTLVGRPSIQLNRFIEVLVCEFITDPKDIAKCRLRVAVTDLSRTDQRLPAAKRLGTFEGKRDHRYSLRVTPRFSILV